LAFKNIIGGSYMLNSLEIVNLNYPGLFSNLNLKVKKDQFITISGSNNCGKTTLIKILSRDIETSNSIYIENEEINSYKIEELSKKIQTVIPLNIRFFENTLEEEIQLLLQEMPKGQEFYNYLIQGLKIKKILTKDFSTLTKKEIVLSQIALSLLNQPAMILLDNIDNYLSMKEVEQVFSFLKDYREKFGLSVIITTIHLEVSLFTDYLYVIDNKNIALEGNPIEVLQNDNVLNKIGLALPFMIDLSVKLRDYDLTSEIETDIDRMVDILWK